MVSQSSVVKITSHYERRFIHELGTYDVLERFLDAAFKMFDEGDIMQKAPMLQAKLLMISGVMFDNWGQFENSIKQFEECLDIAQKNLDANDEFLGGIYNDLGNVSESMDEPQKAVEWHKKAWQIRSQTNDPTGEGVGHSQSNTARSLLMLGEDEEAGKMMEAAELCFHKASAWFHESQ
jgi:tetratricopeptide (TPR) repeat protein